MEFAKDYFEDEVRNGFYIPGIMKRCWAASIEVMGEIVKNIIFRIFLIVVLY